MMRALVSLLCVVGAASTSSSSWNQLADAPWYPRSAATVTFDPSTGGYLMAGGTEGWNGTDTEHYWLNEVWRIDTAGKWSLLSSNSGWQARQNPGFTATKQVAILAGGEAWHPPTQTYDTWNDVWSMDLASGTFTQLPAAPWKARTGHGMVTLNQDTLLMAGGGSCRSCMFRKTFNDVWKYSVKSKQWLQLPDAPWKARWFHGMVATAAGEVVVAGGQTGLFDNSETWKMDLKGTWTLLQKAPWSARSQFGFIAAPASPVAVLAGGMNAGDDAWLLHTGTGEWTQLPSLPTSDFGAALMVWGDDDNEGMMVQVSGGSVPCKGWHCGEQQFVETSAQWQVALNRTAAALVETAQ